MRAGSAKEFAQHLPAKTIMWLCPERVSTSIRRTQENRRKRLNDPEKGNQDFKQREKFIKALPKPDRPGNDVQHCSAAAHG